MISIILYRKTLPFLFGFKTGDLPCQFVSLKTGGSTNPRVCVFYWSRYFCLDAQLLRLPSVEMLAPTTLIYLYELWLVGGVWVVVVHGNTGE